MMIKKLILSLIVIMTMAFSVTGLAKEPPKNYTLSLEQAIETAQTESPEIECAEVNKKNYQKQLKDAAITQRESRDLPVYANKNFELVYVKNGYYVRLFRGQLALADDEIAKTKASIAYDTTKKYYGCRNAERIVDTAKNAVSRAEENLNIIKEKFDLGICTKLDVDGAELSLAEAKANLSDYTNSLELSYDAFKIRLNIEEDCTFTLTDDVSTEAFSADFESDCEKALNSRYDIKALKLSRDSAKDYFDITNSLSESSAPYYSAYTKYVQSDYNYKNGIKNIALGIKSSYYNVVSTGNKADLAKRKLELKNKEYEVLKVRHDMGMITSLMLTSKSDEVTMAEIAYENALLDYKLAYEKYKYDITIGI